MIQFASLSVLPEAFLLQSPTWKGNVSMLDDNDRSDELVDPDPFLLGTVLLQMIIAGAAYLETRRNAIATRRQTELMINQMTMSDERYKNRFRTKYFNAVRAVLEAHRIVGTFESHMREHRFEGFKFEYGTHRLYTLRSKVRELQAFTRDANSVSAMMSSSLDELGEFLGDEYQRNTNKIHEKLRELQHSQYYELLVYLSFDAIELFAELLDDVNSESIFQMTYLC